MKKYAYLVLGLIITVVVVVVGIILLSKILNSKEKSNTNDSPIEDDTMLIKSLPIDIQSYNPDTRMAGDFLFTNEEFGFNSVFLDYGFYIPASSAGPGRYNPQPTFFAPIGTKVHSIVDGEVTHVSKLYSNDYSIAVESEDNSSPYVFELEHVINPTVKVGDRVKAGEVVAEVSDYMTNDPPGLGLVEIGILIGGQTPKHTCPFLYLHPDYKDEIIGKLTRFYKDWNAFTGKDIYNLSDYNTVGCLTIEEIEG